MVARIENIFTHNYIIDFGFVGNRLGGWSVPKNGAIKPGDGFFSSYGDAWDDGEFDYTYLGRVGETGIAYRNNDAVGNIYVATDDPLIWGEGIEILKTGVKLFDPRREPPTGDDDFVIGTAKGDTIDGLGGDDRIEGRNGHDTLLGSAGNDRLYGEEGRDTLTGGGGSDSLHGDEAPDRLKGGTGDDALNGGDGRDRLWGQKGDDRLNGNQGNDWMKGGGGADTFAFESNWGRDRIADFNVEQDEISLYAITFGGGVPDSMKVRNVDDGLLLKLGDDWILLEGLNKSDFGDIDFIA